MPEDYKDFGTVNGIYRYENDRSEWENHERALADLDKASGYWRFQYSVCVRSDVALQVWTDLVDNELLEGPESTPYHLNPARAPEYALLFDTVEYSIESLDHGRGMFRDMLDAIQSDISRAFGRACLRGPIENTTGHLDREPYLQCPYDSMCGLNHITERFGLRPGFTEFVTRTLERMLHFLVVRRCSCHEGTGRLFRNHGLRRYYNDYFWRVEVDAALQVAV